MPGPFVGLVHPLDSYRMFSHTLRLVQPNSIAGRRSHALVSEFTCMLCLSRIGSSTFSMRAYILQDIPRLEIPLHTLIELVPKPDGKMAETRISIDVDSDGPPQVLATSSLSCMLLTQKKSLSLAL